MADVTIPQLEGERVRYNDDTWELTGKISFQQNGSVIEAAARKPDRVRGSRGQLRFKLQNPPASINPGNPGEFDIDLTRDGRSTSLVLTRPSGSNRYSIVSLRYE